MTRIAEGETFRCAKFKSGESGRGPWELIQITDEKGKNPMSIFPTNLPTHGGEGQDFVVKKIVEVKVGNRKQSDGSWRQSTTVAAEVTFIKSDILVDDGDGTEDLPDGWDDLNLDMDIGLPL